ncbi:hypothetical protein B6N60_01967 [Richelia sinica FACHB-800]|uniref:Uncharacterized protein n=1 Tax=Richelia sinica FACHB-800 TaxID=1357546 RepID=A0A975Y4K7_9NOST|nr:hypothetical protein [Richelia sinica]QXE23278.1 hypothetical protein B6N60_01967 [Richelia sinica FACHB-800]
MDTVLVWQLTSNNRQPNIKMFRITVPKHGKKVTNKDGNFNHPDTKETLVFI